MKNRGYTLLIDALMSLFFLLLIVTAFFSIGQPGKERTEVMSFKELHYMSEDALDVLNKKGVLDEVATFWAENSTPGSPQMVNASNLSREYLDKILSPKVGYELVLLDGVDEYPVCNRTLEGGSMASTHSTRVLVGYGRGLPTIGYVAGASLDAIKSNKASSYIYFGGFVGQGNITRVLNLPLDADITGGYMELNSVTQFNLYVNGNLCGGPYTPFSGNMTADNWTLDKSCFSPDVNRIDINFTSLENNFIGGGYIRVDYETGEEGTIPEFATYWFPGIKGVINLYSSFYVPGRSLSSINAYLHYNNNITNVSVYLIIANETVYSSNATGEQFITLSNNDFTGLDYYELELKTVPLRMGTGNISYIFEGAKNVDVVLITDRTGSMGAKDVLPANEKRMDVTQVVNKLFIDAILNVSGNRIATVGFGTRANPVCSRHDLVDDKVELYGRIDKLHYDDYTGSNEQGGYCGTTCIPCGIYEAVNLLTEGEALYNTKMIADIDRSMYRVGVYGNLSRIVVRFDDGGGATNLSLYGMASDDLLLWTPWIPIKLDLTPNRPNHFTYTEAIPVQLQKRYFKYKLVFRTTNPGVIDNITAVVINNKIMDNYPAANWDGTLENLSLFWDTSPLWENGAKLGLSGSNLSGNYISTIKDLGPRRISQQIPLNLDLDIPNFLKARLELFGDRINNYPEYDYKNCVFLNGHYVGRGCMESPGQIYDGLDDLWDTGWKTCSYEILPEWLNDGVNVVKVTGGNKTDCEGSGDNIQWNFTEVRLTVWESSSGVDENSYADSNAYAVGTAGNIVRDINLNLNINESRIRSAYLSFEYTNVSRETSTRYREFMDCIYVNDNYLGRMDHRKLYNYDDGIWRNVTFDVPIGFLENGSNTVSITGGTQCYCRGDASGSSACPGWFSNVQNDVWSFRNLKLTIREDDSSGFARNKSMLVMSDGSTYTALDYAYYSAPGELSRKQSVNLACEARERGVSIYSVAFGAASDPRTLTQVACWNCSACDPIVDPSTAPANCWLPGENYTNCSRYYESNNVNELTEIYQEIAEKIVNTSFQAQTIVLAGNFSTDNILYPDSYIRLDYSPIATLRPRETPITFESPVFGNNGTNGSFWVPNGTRVIDAKITSYSGPYWTDRLYVKNATDSSFKRVYWLDDYAGGKDYRFFGDPYTVNIPVNVLGEGYNLVNISSGESPNDPRGGSPSDRAIYTVALKAYVGYGKPKKTLEGCNWTVQFYDNANVTMKVPSSYPGNSKCNYTNSTYINKEYNNESAIDDAVYRLFTVLDRHSASTIDGRLNIKFDPEDFVVDSTTVGGIRSLWGPIRVKLILWM